MLQAGFASVPTTKFLILALITTSLLASLSDSKHLFHVQVSPHLLQYGQWWRVGVWQLVYANAGEVMFGCILGYQIRVVERMVGWRKFASFVAYTFVVTSIITPLILLILRPLTGLNYLPPGPTPLLFAILSYYKHVIPRSYNSRFRFEAASSGGNPNPPELVISDKFTTYILGAQLALSQTWGSVLAAAVGWVVGWGWREEVFPGVGWRLPKKWFVRREGVEELRRRIVEGGRR